EGPSSSNTSPHRMIANSPFCHPLRIVHIPPVKNHGLLQRLLDEVKIWCTELLPLRDDDEGIGALECGFFGSAEAEVVAAAVDALGFFHGFRVVGLDFCTGFP